jgi:hypothetical protein
MAHLTNIRHSHECRSCRSSIACTGDGDNCFDGTCTDCDSADEITHWRFVVAYPDDNSVAILTEQELSRRIDMSDCEPEPCLLMSVWKGGRLQAVTVGPQQRVGGFADDRSLPHYAEAALITEDGTVVGHVSFTDH